MKKITLFFVAVLFFLQAWAYDFTDSNGIAYNIASSNSAYVTGGVYYTGSVNIPSTVSYQGTVYSIDSIGSEAFSYCSELTSITIPPSVTSIGAFAFYNCQGLTSITIPSLVTSIGFCAFYYCRSLSTINIPNTTTTIGSYAFYMCNLTSINIPASVTSIGSLAFYGCPFTDINVDSNNPSYSSNNGALFNKEQTTLILFPKRRLQYSYSIPNSVTSIESLAFANCGYLTSITIPTSVTSIGSQGFLNCYNVSSITIPVSVTFIGVSAFSLCRGLNLIIDINNASYSCSNGVLFNADKTTLVEYLDGLPDTIYSIPNSVKRIEDYAFCSCINLTEIKIPNSVIIIGENAFADCENLTSIKIPNSVMTIKQSAFDWCEKLKSVDLPASITSIEDYTFSACFSLTSLNIPVSVTSIGLGAFSNCKFTSMTIPVSVTSIGLRAFSYCGSLTSIHANSSVPIDLPNPIDLYYADQVFSKIHSGAILYVPKGSKSAYQNANQWKDFANIIEEDIVSSKIIASTNPITGGKINGTLGTFPIGSSCLLTATSNLGYVFTNWTDAKGNILTTEKYIPFILNKDTTLIANFALSPTTSIVQPTATTLTGTINVFPSSGYTYSIDGINYQNSNVFSGLGIGIYLVTVKKNDNDVSKPILAVIDASGVVSNQNYQIKTTNCTCRGYTDGKIEVTTAKSLDYAVTITRSNYQKTDTFTGASYRLTNLESGSYEICFTISGLSNYQQCFTVTITQPLDLIVLKASVSNNNALYIVGGASNYYVTINNKTTEMRGDSIKLAFLSSENKIKITTDKLCQGVYEETIYSDGMDQITIFPNPTEGKITIGIISKDEKVTIEIFSMNGESKFKQNFTVPQNKMVNIDGSNFANGTYIVSVNGNSLHSSIKIVKK